MNAEDPRHGTVAGYSVHRRSGTPACEPCLAAMRADWKRRQLASYAPGLVPATGTVRRIQALSRMGWTWAEISAASGLTVYTLRRIGQFDRVAVETDERARLAFRQLAMRTPPPSPRRNSVVLRAIRRGWASPLAWDDIDNDPEPDFGGDERSVDPVVVERILAGAWRLKATSPERREVVRAWRQQGRSVNELGRLTGWKVERYVERGEAA
jgi:hypothetical protein